MASSSGKAKHKKTSVGGGGSGGGGGGGAVTGNAKKVLSAIAAIREKQQIINAPRSKVANMCNIKEKNLPCILSGLKKNGYVEYPDKTTVCITEKGMDHADISMIKIPENNSEAQEELKITHGLKPKECDFINCISDGNIYQRIDVMSKLEIKAKATFAGMMSGLKGKGLIEYPDKHTVQLTDMCVPFGRSSN